MKDNPTPTSATTHQIGGGEMTIAPAKPSRKSKTSRTTPSKRLQKVRSGTLQREAHQGQAPTQKVPP